MSLSFDARPARSIRSIRRMGQERIRGTRELFNDIRQILRREDIFMICVVPYMPQISKRGDADCFQKGKGPKEPEGRRQELDYFHARDSAQISYYRIPKLLFIHPYYHRISTDAKVLYGLLLDRMQLSLKNRWYNEDGRVYIYYTIQEIMDRMSCGNQKAVSMMKELDSESGIGLIEKKRQGRGKPNAIYVKNFASVISWDPELFLGSEKCENHDPGNVNITSLEMWKSHPNNTDKNKTEPSETDPSYQGGQTLEGMSQVKKETVRKVLEKRTGYQALIHDYPEEAGLIDGLMDLMTDIMAMPDKALIRIGGSYRPATVVKSQFSKIDMMHIQYVLSCLEANTSKIHNIRNYMLTALYNAPMTMEGYYRAEVQHDLNENTVYEDGDRHALISGKKSSCCRDSYSENHVNGVVFGVLKKHLGELLALNEKIDSCTNQATSKQSLEIKCLEKEIKALRLQKIEIYESYAEGTLSLCEYQRQKEDLVQTIEAKEERLAALKSSDLIEDDFKLRKDQFCGKVADVMTSRKLTREMVERFIDVVYVYDFWHIEVVFSFEDLFREFMERAEETKTVIKNIS